MSLAVSGDDVDLQFSLEFCRWTQLESAAARIERKLFWQIRSIGRFSAVIKECSRFAEGRAVGVGFAQREAFCALKGRIADNGDIS